MSKHTDFILSPITDILKDVVSANKAIGNGIDTYPLGEYIFQSAFLKMTGAQEQKMKCICWDLATYNYEYRYMRYTLKPLGECSAYKDKSAIYNDLINLIKQYNPKYDILGDIDRALIASGTIEIIKDLFANSALSTWAEQMYLEFAGNADMLPDNQFARPTALFESKLIERYELLYKHRNRCAHNTSSYQENLPTLKALFHSNHKYDNYFVRFALLILIDTIFIHLYGRYKTLLEEN